MTPGTPRSDGTCSLSYTSLKSASLSGRTLMAALKRYRVWIGIAVSFGGARTPSSSLLNALVASRPVPIHITFRGLDARALLNLLLHFHRPGHILRHATGSEGLP